MYLLTMVDPPVGTHKFLMEMSHMRFSYVIFYFFTPSMDANYTFYEAHVYGTLYHMMNILIIYYNALITLYMHSYKHS